MAGFSGTPLRKKLGIAAHMNSAALNPPWPYAEELGLEFCPLEIARDEGLPHGLDFIHLFTTRRDELEARLKQARSTMSLSGMIWVSWPKKSSRLASEITEDTVRELCLPIGLVDIKVCAVDSIWSGLKLVIRKELR